MDLSALKCRDQFPSTEYGEALIVNQLSYGKVPVADVLAGTAAVQEIVATGDGKSYIAQWHDGEVAGEVYCERWELRAGVAFRAFHGWLDSVSRKIVQAG
jgi:hypothetical protein